MKRVSTERAERLLLAFREHSEIPHAAAKKAGVDSRTARKAWKEGLASCPDPRYHEPFRDIVARAKEEARARMEREEEEIAQRAVELEAKRRAKVKADAAKDATDSTVQEASMVRMARQGAIVLLNTIGQVSAGASTVGKKVRESLEEIGKDPTRKLTLAEAIKVTQTLNRLTTALRQANDAAQRAMEMERLLLGEPTKIVGHVEFENVTVDEAKRKLASMQRAIQTLELEGIEALDDVPHDPKLH